MMTLIDLSSQARHLAERLLEDKFGHEQKYIVAEVVFGRQCPTIQFDVFSDFQDVFDAETGELSQNWRLERIGVEATVYGDECNITKTGTSPPKQKQRTQPLPPF